jgi:hypothetical protein
LKFGDARQWPWLCVRCGDIRIHAYIDVSVSRKVQCDCRHAVPSLSRLWLGNAASWVSQWIPSVSSICRLIGGLSVMREAVLLLDDGDECRAIMASGSGQIRFRSCSSTASLARAVTAPAVEAVIYEPGMGLASAPDILRHIETHRIRLILRLDLRRVFVAEVVTLTRQVPHLNVSLRMETGPVSHTQWLDRLLNSTEDGPVVPVMNEVSASLQREAYRCVIGALALGARCSRRRTWSIAPMICRITWNLSNTILVSTWSRSRTAALYHFSSESKELTPALLSLLRERVDMHRLRILAVRPLPPVSG